MESDGQENPALGPSLSDTRLLVEIETWDWNLHVGLSPASAPPEDRFQGGLLYTRGLQIQGRVVAPKTHRSKTISIWISPIGPEVRFGEEGLKRVGQFYAYAEHSRGRNFGASLFLPEDSLSNAMICLSSTWRYVHLWVGEDLAGPQGIERFSFSRDIHENLISWAREL
jgi:hypothetical protein